MRPDFFDIKGISDTVDRVLSDPEEYTDIAKQGRETIIDNYDLNKVCLPKSIELIEKALLKYPNTDLALMKSICLLYTSPSPRDRQKYRMPSSA